MPNTHHSRFSDTKLDDYRRPTCLYVFVVKGTGKFPVDMLRHDRCWPLTGDNAHLVEWTNQTERRVTLCSYQEPTPDRWASFGWACDGTAPKDAFQADEGGQPKVWHDRCWGWCFTGANYAAVLRIVHGLPEEWRPSSAAWADELSTGPEEAADSPAEESADAHR